MRRGPLAAGHVMRSAAITFLVDGEALQHHNAGVMRCGARQAQKLTKLNNIRASSVQTFPFERMML